MENTPLTTEYAPISVDEKASLPVMSFTGLSKKKYLVLPDEYFNVEEHVLLGGVTLIPMRNQFDETE